MYTEIKECMCKRLGVRLRLTLPALDEDEEVVLVTVCVGTVDSASVLSSESPIVCDCFKTKPISSPGCFFFFFCSYSKYETRVMRKVTDYRDTQTVLAW